MIDKNNIEFYLAQMKTDEIMQSLKPIGKEGFEKHIYRVLKHVSTIRKMFNNNGCDEGWQVCIAKINEGLAFLCLPNLGEKGSPAWKVSIVHKYTILRHLKNCGMKEALFLNEALAGDKEDIVLVNLQKFNEPTKCWFNHINKLDVMDDWKSDTITMNTPVFKIGATTKEIYEWIDVDCDVEEFSSNIDGLYYDLALEDDFQKYCKNVNETFDKLYRNLEN